MHICHDISDEPQIPIIPGHLYRLPGHAKLYIAVGRGPETTGLYSLRDGNLYSSRSVTGGEHWIDATSSYCIQKVKK